MLAPIDISPQRCSSLIATAKRLDSDAKKAGRKLEGDKPLDERAAEQERAAAQRDPDIAAALAAELGTETDPARRLLIEATVMHDKGLYKARDLLLMQLRQAGAK